MVATGLRQIAKTHGSASANRARAALSALYAWAIGEDLCVANPVIGTNKAKEAGPRERVLSDAELAAVWNAAGDTDFGWIIKLLILTGQRKEEFASLRWSEIDMGAKTITLPGDSH